MTIEILNTQINNDGFGNPVSRTVEIKIDDPGTGIAYRHFRGGLPIEGNLQAILDAEETRLLRDAKRKKRIFSVLDVEHKKLFEAFVVLWMKEESRLIDAINESRIALLQPEIQKRSREEIETALKNELANLA